MNSGAEAVETVIKAVRKWSYKVKGIPEDKAEIIVCANNFHGRTITIVGFSTDPRPAADSAPSRRASKSFPSAMPRLWKRPSPPTAGFLVEPIQGEAGVIIPPAGYLKAAREICDRHNVVLILDEIQTGLGRTGRLLAEEHEGIEADLTLVGKALSGGFYPVSAVLSNKEVMDVLQPGEHGSTFGGNPLACAIARTAMRVLKEEKMIENASKMGDYFLAGLKKIQSPHIKEGRGRGLMIAMELIPEAGGARQFCYKLADRGMLCKETHENTIRFAPPLVIKKDEVDWALEQIDAVMKA
jgi:ornithine--oxo-acid transaminase